MHFLKYCGCSSGGRLRFPDFAPLPPWAFPLPAVELEADVLPFPGSSLLPFCQA